MYYRVGGRRGGGEVLAGAGRGRRRGAHARHARRRHHLRRRRQERIHSRCETLYSRSRLGLTLALLARNDLLRIYLYLTPTKTILTILLHKKINVNVIGDLITIISLFVQK